MSLSMFSPRGDTQGIWWRPFPVGGKLDVIISNGICSDVLTSIFSLERQFSYVSLGWRIWKKKNLKWLPMPIWGAKHWKAHKSKAIWLLLILLFNNSLGVHHYMIKISPTLYMYNMYQCKVDVDMQNTVKSVLADILSVSPSSELILSLIALCSDEGLMLETSANTLFTPFSKLSTLSHI